MLFRSHPLATFPHGGWVYSAVFNREETRILTASGDRTAKLWGIPKLNLVQTLFTLLLDLAQKETVAMNFDAIAERYKITKDGIEYLTKEQLRDILRSLPTNIQAAYRQKYNLEEEIVEQAPAPQNTPALQEWINWLQESNAGENQ